MMKLKPPLQPSVTIGLVAAAGAVLVLGILPSGSPAPKLSAVPAVELREEGFVPATLVVRRGTTVTFSTARGKPFWPASDIHPTHSIYSEFDPRKPVEHGDSWTFQFDRAGEWRYHDHLAPGERGTIVVKDDTRASRSGECQELERLDQATKQRCFSTFLADAMEQGGIAEAYVEFRRLYRADDQFAVDSCHWYAHVIGELAYAKYFKDGNIGKVELPAETLYCGYGFYHGLFEHLFRDNPDTALVKNLCNDLGERYGKELPRVRVACYHAAGHGFVAEPRPASAAWGNPQKMVEPALRVCDTISDIPYEVRECREGAFNVIANWSGTNDFGLSPPGADDPFRLCRAQPKREWGRACYFEFSMRLNRVIKDDITVFYDRYVRDLGDEELGLLMIRTAAAAIMEDLIPRDDFAPVLSMCRGLPALYQRECLRGVILGFTAHGEPEREHVKASRFCSLRGLREDERQLCFNELVAILKSNYSSDVMKGICESYIDERYRAQCPR